MYYIDSLSYFYAHKVHVQEAGPEPGRFMKTFEHELNGRFKAHRRMQSWTFSPSCIFLNVLFCI